MLKNCLRVILVLSLLSAGTSRTFACNLPPGSGFTILDILTDLTGPFPVDDIIPDQLLKGVFAGPVGTPGITSSWEQVTDNNGELTRLGYASPADWQITYESGPCSLNLPNRGGPVFTQRFAASSTPQEIICVLERSSDAIAASPNSFDTSVGSYQYTMTMTDNSEAWHETPVNWVNFDIAGNFMQSGSIGGVTDAYNCWAYFTPYYDTNRGAATQYIWLTDSNGLGIGYATISVTNGTGGGG